MHGAGTPLPRFSIPRAITATLLIAASFLSGCRSKDFVPKPDSKPYLQFTNAFYTGLAALQVGDDVRAESSLSDATRLAPGEPAAWANWGVLALRQRGFDAAFDRLNHAHTLAPSSDQIDYLLGLLESERGNSAAAITDLELAVQSNPANLRALYQLASEVERQGGQGSDQRFQKLIQQILTTQPHNLAAQLELSRIAAKRGDIPTLNAAVTQIAAAAHSGSPWPADVTQQLTELQVAASSPQPRSAATRSIFLRNVLMRVPEFRTDLADLKPQPGEGAQPLTQLLRAENPPSTPSPADTALNFTPQSAPASPPQLWSGSINLNGADTPILAQATATELHLASGAALPFPGNAATQILSPESVLPIDINYDFKTDLALAGPTGVRLFRQDDPAHFTDVTAQTKLPPAILNAPYTGAWAVDIEADGDLDILLGALSGPPTLLRNNGDGTFTPGTPFPHISGLRQLVWVDLNGDGNPDAALIDAANHLHIFLNQRSGNFTESPIPVLPGETKAIAAADLSSNVLTLVAVQSTGAILRLDPATLTAAPAFWSTHQIATVANPATELSGDLRLHAADLDNNGAVDLLLAPNSPPVSGQAPILWLQTETGTFQQLQQPITPTRIFDLADLKSDGHLALIGLTETGLSAVSTSQGSKNYHWQTIRPRARQSTGDQRINSFGIGGEIEIRSGLLVQKQPITRPELHFGLGDHTQSDVARILWPNGSVRAEFALQANQQIVTEQRLKGSCPFLFAWDGYKMSFVKDSVPWGSAIGLRINALGTAKIAATEEWFKIPREQLQPRTDATGSYYDLRVTGELWETYYYDALSLMTVDHPAGTEVFTDERYDVPPVKLAVTAVTKPQPITRAVDDNGQDVTKTLTALDGQYLDTFGRGQYQGITRDHFVEIDLPDQLPNQKLYLIAKGWLHPSDSSVNVALGQGSGAKPHWLSLEAVDAQGHWHVANPNLGSPAGRNKICLIDLTGVFAPGMPHRLRLRTNLEIFWDQIQWAEAAPQTDLRITHLAAQTADLHYRGFSSIHQANPSSPELPDYNTLASTTPIWRDLEGFYTRFGDVRELLAHSDDRSVIMNAGDEMSLRFAAPAPPPPGWVRDFVLAGDGWIKDGDYNTSYAQNVLPYPHHDRRDYDTPPVTLEEDWVYRHHPEDFATYQTRYLTPEPFLNALRPESSRATQSGIPVPKGPPSAQEARPAGQSTRSTAAQ
jgi:Tfp pilus assembly protein PilF